MLSIVFSTNKPKYLDRQNDMLNLEPVDQIFKGRCNQAATCDVMMDKSKYFYRFVKFSVGNVIYCF